MHSPELPLMTHVHGMLFTGWFMLFVVQATLVNYRRLQLHQTIGKIGGLLALGMSISGFQILYNRTLEFDGSATSLANTALVLCGNFVLLLLFMVFVGLGIRNRRKAEMHKRLILLACISMMPQALGRIGKIPSDNLLGIPNEVTFGLGGMLFFIVLLWSHDLLRSGRLHPVSAVGGPIIMATIIIAALLLPDMAFVRDFVVWINASN